MEHSHAMCIALRSLMKMQYRNKKNQTPEVSAYNQQQKYRIKNHATKEMWIFTVLDLTELLWLSF